MTSRQSEAVITDRPTVDHDVSFMRIPPSLQSDAGVDTVSPVRCWRRGSGCGRCHGRACSCGHGRGFGCCRPSASLQKGLVPKHKT